MKNARLLVSLLFASVAFAACSVSPTAPDAGAIADASVLQGPPLPPPPPVDPGGDN